MKRSCRSHGPYTRVGRCPACKQLEHQVIPLGDLLGAVTFLYLIYLLFPPY